MGRRNGSTDGSVEAVRKRFPDVRVIENGENLGFAKANNRALEQMNGRYAVILNSDTVLTEGSLDELLTFMDENRDAGICGGQLINGDGSKQNSVTNIPTLATALLNKSLLRRLFPHRYPGKEHVFKGPVVVDSIIGACMVVRKEAIDEVGLIDEACFFFFEETDWCLEMKKRGWKVYHYPCARIYHFHGQSAGRVNVRARIEYWRSRYVFFKKHHPKFVVAGLTAGLVARLCINLVIYTLMAAFSLFKNEHVVNKLKVSIALLLWHFRGLPEGYGFKVQGALW